EDLREAGDGAAVVAQGGENGVRPEPRSVLADPPPFLLEPAFGGGGGQRALGSAAIAGIRGEGRGGSAQGLARAKARDVLGPRVPGGRRARRIQGDDRVVLHRLHEAAEMVGLAGGGLLGGLVTRLAQAGRVPHHTSVHCYYEWRRAGRRPGRSAYSVIRL